MRDGSVVRAVAVTSSQGSTWVAAYALLLILIFVAIARILKDIVIGIFPLRGNGNRYALLVGYYNTNDPVSIIIIAVSYCWKILFYVNGDGLWGIDWNTFWLGVSLIVFALGMLTANAVGGVLVPGNLRLGNVARVRPDSIFFPNLTNIPPEVSQNYMASQAFSALADLNRVGSKLKDERKIIFGHSNTTPVSGGEDPPYSFNYTYYINGYDFGLQRAPSLLYTVSGSCETAYNWRLSRSNKTVEIYQPWKELNESNTIGVFQFEEKLPPYVEFLALKKPISSEDRVREYAIVPHTARRPSPKANTDDIWYTTEEVNGTAPLTYRVKLGRPALSCQQRDTWMYGGRSVDSELGLPELVSSKGLKLSRFIQEKVFQRAFSAPAVAKVTNTLGYSALIGSSLNIAYTGSADISHGSVTAELERIILVSFIWSREVVRSTVLTSKAMQDGLANTAIPNGANAVPDEVADFVVEDGNITTMSVNVLIATPAVCLLLWVFIGLKGTFIFANTWRKIKNDSFRARYTQRTIAFSAIQLYRYLDEELSGERRWKGRISFTPFVDNVTTYTRRYSEFEVAPVSARVTTPTTSPISRYSKASNEDDAAHYFSSDDPGVEAAEQSKPLVYVTPFARPALVPLHQRSYSSPESKSFTSVSTIPSFSFSAANRRPTSHYTTRDDQFELAMTRHWRPSLRPDDDVRWSQVQRD